MARKPKGFVRPPARRNDDLVFDALDDEPVIEARIDSFDPDPKVLLTLSEQDHFRAVLNEIASRESEALALYEPMPNQEEFHASQAPERLILGGNRGGKTVSECVEIARAVTGQDPHGKFSLRDGVAIVVGKNYSKVGLVLYPKLFLPGAFKVIADPITGKLRAYRPWQPWDAENEHLAVPAPPLIPHRFYRDKDVSWEDKRQMIPKTVRIRGTGWILNFFSSESAPPNGMDANLAAFDEEIEHPQWYTECAARLLDRRQTIMRPDGTKGYINGRFWWGATPQSGTEQLFALADKADNLVGTPNPVVQKFDVSLLDNSHIDTAAKNDFIAKLAGDEAEYNVRVLGQFAILGSRVYGECEPRGAHGVPTFAIPWDWCRYTFVDPGRQVCAVLFVAVPPPGVNYIKAGDTEIYCRHRAFIYDELYIKRADAKIYARKFKDKVGDQIIYRNTIDHKGGSLREIGSGKLPMEQYADELKAVGFKCETTGHRFSFSNDDRDAGILAVRSGLHLDEDGRSRWAIMHEKVPNFLHELKGYVYKKIPRTNQITDATVDRNNHLMDCWRYAAMIDLRYHKPKVRPKGSGGFAAIIKEKKKRAKAVERGPGDGDSIKCY